MVYLGLLDGGVEPVAHGRDLHAGVSFPVALPEKLLHDPVNPLPVDLQRLRRAREVRAVNHVLKNLRKKKTGAGWVAQWLKHRLNCF